MFRAVVQIGVVIGAAMASPHDGLARRQSSLELHFDVVAFDHDSVAENTLKRWRPQDRTGFQVEFGTVPWTSDRGALKLTLRQRPAVVRACVRDGIISSLDVEEGDSLAIDGERTGLAGGDVFNFRYLNEVCHRAALVWPGSSLSGSIPFSLRRRCRSLQPGTLPSLPGTDLLLPA